MPLRVNPILLLSIIISVILSFAIFAEALGGGTAGDAVGVGEGQMGKPFVMSTDGPNTFSCSGLIRYILRTTGVDGNAPWVPEAYLAKYAPVAPGNIQPGDVVIYPDWATMYVGNGMVLNANEVLGKVTETPMGVAGTPEGIVRPPYAGQRAPGGVSNPTTSSTVTNSVLSAVSPMDTDPAAGQGQYNPTLLPAQGLLSNVTNALAPLPSDVPQDPPGDTIQSAPVPAAAPDPPAGQGQYDPTLLPAQGLLGNVTNALAPLPGDVPQDPPGDTIQPAPVPAVAPDPPAGQGQYDPMMLGTPDLPGNTIDTLPPPPADVSPATAGDAIQPIGDAAPVL